MRICDACKKPHKSIEEYNISVLASKEGRDHIINYTYDFCNICLDRLKRGLNFFIRDFLNPPQPHNERKTDSDSR